MKKIPILTLVLLFMFSCNVFAADSKSTNSDITSYSVKEHLIFDALNTTYYFEPYSEENHIAQLKDGQFSWQECDVNCSLKKIESLTPAIGAIMLNGVKRNVVAWGALYWGGGTGIFTEIMIAVEQPDGTIMSRQPISIGDRIYCRKISISRNKIVIDYLDHRQNQAMAEAPTIPKKYTVTLND